MTLPISIIVAVAENGVIGSDGDMPWKLSSDLKRFKAITIGNPIIMGRKTFESIGRPLPGRHNIVISRNTDYSAEGICSVESVDQALQVAQLWEQGNGASEICVIGGGEIYRLFLNRADRIYYTKVKAEPSGDTRFPDIDEAIWEVISREFVPDGPRDSCETEFIVYERR